MDKPYLDYYAQHGIIPVRQALPNADEHSRRRELLYRKMGLPRRAFKDARVLELGPGGGDNAAALCRFGPRHIELVDANPASLSALRAKKLAGTLSDNTLIVDSDIVDYTSEAAFDIVLCEGVLQGQNDASIILRKICSLVAPGGFAVITVSPGCGLLSDLCRRLLKPIIAEKVNSFDQQLEQLTSILSPQLANLVGMNRLHRDWVLDVVLHPYKNCILGLEDVLSALQGKMEVVGTSSPSILADWRWYKSIPSGEDVNKLYLDAYFSSLPYFLDCRIVPTVRPPDDLGGRIETLVRQFEKRLQIVWENDSAAEAAALAADLIEIADAAESVCPDAARALKDFTFAANRLAHCLSFDFNSFALWFGRGQMYVCLMRP